ncbi:putative ABC transport system permease protein [Chryseolinea serpens]|uniref:Putative ABC transport system permease protein n=1 Tax=Chryseolinea serpens TaxID=947013 RepID=A0A1M5XUG2_9BACT|nr:ABC transporter permease [Chryseolinea serpens]SHI03362.1 putative ABC transport system permease protein [Chryseolinea serpens]
MLLNYFKIVYRNLQRNKLYAIINIVGLSIGLAVCVIIMQYVEFEKSFDRFHAKSKEIYRIILAMPRDDGSLQKGAANYAPTAPALKNDFPEIVDIVRITPEYGRTVFNIDDKTFEESKVYYADSTLFSVFDFKLIDGDPRTALAEPGSVVMSLTSAEKYFGPRSAWKESPVNQLVRMNNKELLKISGIMEDIPANSHLQLNVILSFTTFLRHNDPSKEWGWDDFYTYIALNPQADYKAFEAKLPAFIRKYKGSEAKELMLLQPLEDIHLHSDVGYELEPNGSYQTVYFLSVIAFIILVIAWVNYVNLATARSERRGKEVGIRKVSGANRKEIVLQMLLESFCMNLIAMALTLAAVYLTLPAVGKMLDKPLEFSLMNDTRFITTVVMLYIGGSLLAGIYPALVLSSFQPMQVLKGASQGIAKGKTILRQALVVLQFVMSAGLVTCTILIHYQLKYVKTQDLGFHYQDILFINSPSTIDDASEFLNSYDYFKKQLLGFPEIAKVSISSALPAKSYNDMDMRGPIKMVGQSEDAGTSFAVYRVDKDFFDVMGIKMIAGKNFTNEASRAQLIGDSTEHFVLVNRKGAALLGYANPADIVGKQMSLDGNPREVMGVFENYHHKSLRNAIEPMIVRNRIASMLYISIRLADNSHLDINTVIGKIRRTWNEVYRESPFIYSFLDQHVEAQYKDDDRFNKIFTLFSVFSVAIACLGLFGLVSYSVSVRIKEIGIRKVLGASMGNIVTLFFNDYLKLLGISFIIGIPLSVYVIDLWLQNFAYRAPLQWWLFFIPALIVTVLAFCTIIGQVVKAAMSDPSKTLKAE